MGTFTSDSKSGAGRAAAVWALTLATSAMVALGLFAPVSLKAQNTASAPVGSSASASPTSSAPRAALPRGKKLMLTDGSYQLVREYQVNGDRVRYYSLDSSQWEEIPASMIDWDATKKVAADEAARDASALAKVHTSVAAHAATPLDIDASLEVAPGVFLPPGANLFVFDGKATLLPMPQAETDSKLSKGRLIEQVMVPIPIVPSRHSISIQGLHAKLRITQGQPEFYIRVVDTRQPELVLIRAKLQKDSRHVEDLDQIFDMTNEKRDAIPMQRWDIAKGVFRFTLSQTLTSGEYAIAEMVRDEGSALYMWDFGVDSASPAAKSATK
jgi:hypothetical protein